MMDLKTLSEAVGTEVALRPSLEPCDLYKLLYQIVMGADHMLLCAPSGRAAATLRAEWDSDSGGGGTIEPPFQVLDPETGIVRLHLRTLRLAGAELESVLEAVLGQPWKHGRSEDAAALWRRLPRLADILPARIGVDDLEAYRLPEGAPHHSAGYGPASYRVLNGWSRLSLIRFGRPQSTSATADR